LKQLKLNLGLDLDPIVLPPWAEIDRVIVSLSGGKDSVCTLLWALEHIPKHKIECWHHLVDGASTGLMDWAITKDYVRQLCKHFQIPIYFSWLSGGIEGEIRRENMPKQTTYFETPTGIKFSGGKGKSNTRLKFPAKSSDLRIRWCSSIAKIDVCRIAIANQERFNGKTIVVLTGERREESAKRNRYRKTQYYCQPNQRRTVYQHRPILDWNKTQVWAKIGAYKINPHPAYHLGWGRLSCLTCIFGSPNQWATIQRDFPDRFERIAELEQELKHSIDSRFNVMEMAAKGLPYPALSQELVELARSDNYGEPIVIDDWKLPLGAYGESNGSD
jgi:3'-phosphoadenosine 5'-phosphosulfate sulfotransferase (PAPS reductase)/FAD synthetase